MVIVISRSEEQKKNVVNAAYSDIIAVLEKKGRSDLIPKYDFYRGQLLSCTDKFAFEKALGLFIGGNLPFLARFYKKDIEQKMKQELDLIFEGCT